MRKARNITLIICSGSLLLIPTACSHIQTTSHNQSAQAAEKVSTESIRQTASAITVKVTAGSSSGSGILVAKSGQTYTVVTNAHVISRGDRYQIETVDGKIHQATLKKSDRFDNQDDLALLQFSATEQYTLATLENTQLVTPNQSVFASGFTDASEQLTFKLGKIEQISPKPLVGGYQIGFTNYTKQGMSGGALLNDEGEVIGILGMGAAAILDNAYLYADGSRPDAQTLKKLRANSFALPVTNLVSSLPEKENKEAGTTVAPSQKYTGLPGKIDSIAEKITVRIDSKNNGNGSGVIIAHNGDTYYVVTAGHVVENQDDYTIVTPDGQSYPVAKATIKTFEGIDLAVVQFQSQQTYSVATLGKYDINDVQWVFVSGFPGKQAETKVQPPRILTAGAVQPKNLANFAAKDSYSLTNGYGLLYTNQSFPGMSGGAVLDTQGRVVGINTGAEDEIVVGKTGDVAEISLGYSLGVPISTLVGLANSAKINSVWLQQDSSQPSKLTEAEFASLEEQLFDFPAPSGNATEVDWLNYGNQLWRFSQNDKAIAAFERAIQLNPNSYRAYYGKGLAFFAQEKDRQANDAFEQATKLAADFYPAWLGLGRTFEQLKQYSQALNAYDRAIQLSPKDFVSYTERGVVFTELKRYREAISSFNQAIEIQPHPRAYNNRGNAYANLKDYQAAIADYDRALKLDPNYADAYVNRGNIYKSLKDDQTAIADYDRALKLNPNFAEAYVNRGNAYYSLKDYQAAIADYDRAIRLDPNFAEAYVNRGNAYGKLKDDQTAIADYDRALKLNPNFAEAYVNRGNAYGKLKDDQTAIADYDRALKLNPNFAEAYFNRGNAYYKLKDYQSAIADYNQALKLDPNFAKAYYNRGLAYYNLKDHQAAIADYDRALKLNPNLAEAYSNRGIAYADLKDYQTAIADYSQAIKRNPNYANAYYNRAFADGLSGDTPSAIADIQKAAQLYQQQGNTEGYQRTQGLLQQVQEVK